MVDRDVGTFHNESKLIRMLDGRIAGQVAMPTRPVDPVSTRASNGGEAGEENEGDEAEQQPVIESKRAAQNRMRKQRKRQTRR